MNDDATKENPSAFTPPVSSFTGPIAELIAQRMLFPPSRPGLLAILDQFGCNYSDYIHYRLSD